MILEDSDAISSAIQFLYQYETEQQANDDNVSEFSILSITVNEDETLHMLKRYQGEESVIFSENGWDNDYFEKRLIALEEIYQIEYVDPKWMSNGKMGAYVYLLLDDNGEWYVWDRMFPWELPDDSYVFDEDTTNQILTFMKGEVNSYLDDPAVIDVQILQAEINYEETEHSVSAYRRIVQSDWSEEEFKEHFAAVEVVYEIEYLSDAEESSVDRMGRYKVDRVYYILENQSSEWRILDLTLFDSNPI